MTARSRAAVDHMSEERKDFIASMVLKVVQEVGRTMHSGAVEHEREPTGAYVPKDCEREVMKRA